MSWIFLIGYPWSEALEILEEQSVNYEVHCTAPPGKRCNLDEAYVIAVRETNPLTLICASPDWNVK